MKEMHEAVECVREWDGESPWDGMRWQNGMRKTLRLSSTGGYLEEEREDKA